MQRVVSIWFPYWPIDRLRRRLASPSPEQPDAPLVTASHNGRRRVIAAVDADAVSLGLQPGMAVAQALTIIPALRVMDAEPKADSAALEQLARWCHRLTPLAAVDPPDGLCLDVTGCSGLWCDEAAMLQALLDRLRRNGLQARAAVADTLGAAHALARYGGFDTPVIIPSGTQAAAIADLSVAALRMPADLTTILRRAGFGQVSHLTRMPRAILARRFGTLPVLRLDQAHGRVPEPLGPLAPEQPLQCRVTFPDPLLTAESLALATAYLVKSLCGEMERAGLGARQVDLVFERVDNQVIVIRIGTVQPSRDTRHLTRLLNERLETIDFGLGVDAMCLTVPLAEPLRWEQQEGGASLQDVARLIDQLARLTVTQPYQAAVRQSEMPDRAVRHSKPAVQIDRMWAALFRPNQTSRAQPPVRPKPQLSLVACTDGCIAEAKTPVVRVPHLRLVQAEPAAFDAESDVDPGEPPLIAWKRPWACEPSVNGVPELLWPGRLHIPSRLFNPPRPIEALAALPDRPPLAFTWRRHRHRVYRADGPERIYGEWWRYDRESKAVRDYYRVEDENGRRFWLFREGNGRDLDTGNLSWFLHGLF